MGPMSQSVLPITRLLRPAAILLALWIIASAVQPVAANAAPPPSTLWLFMDDDPALTQAFEGAQLQRCDDATCSSAALLATAGVCDLEDCLTNPPADAPFFECARGRCLAYSYTLMPPDDTLRVAVQAGGVLYVSSALPRSRGFTDALRLRPDGEQLRVAVADPPALGRNWRLERAALAFGLTLLVETLIGAAVLALLGKFAWGTLRWVTLGTLFTFGAVWFTFPSLGDFYFGAEQAAGTLVLIAGLLLAALTLVMLWSQRRGLRIGIGVSMAVVAALICPLATFMLLIAGYGQYVPDGALGLPYWQTVALSEVFAFAVEAGFLYLATRRGLRLWQAVLISFAANAASYVAGLLAFPFNAL